MLSTLARVALVFGVALAGTLASDAVGAAEPVVTKTMAHGGHTRTYHVLVPDGYDPSTPTPLVLALHGGGGEGSKVDRSTRGQFSREADRKDWLVVFPEGVDKGWNEGRESTVTPRKDVDDVAFLTALIDEVAKDYNVDTNRVYATGISNGGFMSIVLALKASDRVAAVAPVTASIAKVHEHSTPSRPVPILFMNGTEDPLVPYAGGQVTVFGKERGEVLSTERSVQLFAEYNGCTGEQAPAKLPNWAPLDGTRVLVRRAAGCTADVVLYEIQGGGHTWPAGQQYLPKSLVGRVSRDILAVRHIFDFFDGKTLP
jgi:polyhydroxybutyrate depolymerase